MFGWNCNTIILKKIKPYLPLALYSLLYAGLITLGSTFFRYQAAILQMEYAVYDVFQCWLAVDDQQDLLALPKDEQRLIGELFFINLDTSFFNLETDRIQRGRLALLLDTLANHADAKVIFLDFLFDTHSPIPEEDSLLKASIEQLTNKNQQLVLPYGLPPDQYKMYEAADITEDSSLIIDHPYTGYLDYRAPVGETTVHRSTQVIDSDQQPLSAVFAIIQNLEGAFLPNVQNTPPLIEINYRLRNEVDKNKIQAVVPVQARDIVTDPENWLDPDKIIFIGLFEDYASKYDLSIDPIDQFHTPVSPTMNGVYLIINSFLNVCLGNDLRYAGWQKVFLVNLLLVLLGGLYLHRRPEILGTRRRILELLISIVGFGALYFWFYKNGQIKLPLVLMSVFWAMHPHVYRSFVTLFYNKKFLAMPVFTNTKK